MNSVDQGNDDKGERRGSLFRERTETVPVCGACCVVGVMWVLLVCCVRAAKGAAACGVVYLGLPMGGEKSLGTLCGTYASSYLKIGSGLTRD